MGVTINQVRDNQLARNGNGWLPRASVRFTPEVALSA